MRSQRKNWGTSIVFGFSAIACFTLFALFGCNTTPPQAKKVYDRQEHRTEPPPSRDLDQDGAPDNPPDFAALPEPVPRVEPLSKYGNPATYEVFGKTYRTLKTSAGYTERGIASWYGTKFHKRRTSSGEPYDLYAFTAAHKTLPLPCFAEVTNLRNGRKLIVRINDRGPFHDNRVIDLSYAAASRLGILPVGTGLVEVRVIDPRRPGPAIRLASARTSQSDAPVRSETRVATAPNNLYLQVGAFQSRANAERLRDRLQQSVTSAIHVVQAEIAQNTVYRVRIGPLQNVDEADRLTGKLARLGVGKLRVVID